MKIKKSAKTAAKLMRRKRAKGLTLTELLLAAGILVFVLCGLMVLFINCIFLNDANRNLTLATSHAQYILEEIRDSAFTGLEAAIDTGGNWDWSGANIEAHDLALLPNESIDTSVFPSGSPLGVLGVSVTVVWQDRGVRPRSIELQTLIADY
ncbi:MAG: hypothetical protein ABH914_02660 [Candidatus Omnitrophota bacterium]